MCAIVRSGIAGVCVFGVASLGIAAAHADVELLGDPGVALTAGVGVEDFAGAGMRDATGIAGLWDVRVAIGTRSPIAGEVAYVGSASRIASMIGMEEGTLVSSGIEGLLRGNLYTDGAWQPYAFAGAGWRRYSVTGADVSTSDAGMNDSDDVLVLPFGLGCSYRHRGFLAAPSVPPPTKDSY